MTDLQPQLWIERAADAVTFYERAFGAHVLHRVGEGDDIVVQLSVGDGAFWVSRSDQEMGRLSPDALGGATGRVLLVVESPDRVIESAVGAGATELSPVSDEHGWRLGRVRDPFGHEWEIGRPLSEWPPQ